MLIDKDKLLKAIADKVRTECADANHNYLQGFQDCIEVIEAQEDAYKWHDVAVEEDVPDDDRNVLLTFSNFSLPIIGQYRRDSDGGGTWYIGDTDDTFVSENLYVDGWWELPKKPEVSE